MRYAIAVELFGGAVIEAMIMEADDQESAILMAAEHGNVISTPSRIDDFTIEIRETHDKIREAQKRFFNCGDYRRSMEHLYIVAKLQDQLVILIGELL